MVTIIPIILIIISLIIILSIIIRKFPSLAILDVESIPEEKEAKFKERIMKDRFDRELGKLGSEFARIWQTISKKLKSFFSFLYNNLQERKKKYQSQNKLSFTKKKQRTAKIIVEVDENIVQEDYVAAEKKAIEILNYDSHNQEAFEHLGKIYLALKKYDEAKETHYFILKLLQEKGDQMGQAETHFILSEIAEKMDNIQEALQEIHRALAITSNNPRFLDRLVAICVEMKDKKEAVEACRKLTDANPENQKLREWWQKIHEL